MGGVFCLFQARLYKTTGIFKIHIHTNWAASLSIVLQLVLLAGFMYPVGF